jgi:diaminopimelate decarboxylase
MPHNLKDVLPATARLQDDGHLSIGGADAVALADEHGTPLFVLCEETFRSRARSYRSALPDAEIYYAGKAFL